MASMKTAMTNAIKGRQHPELNHLFVAPFFSTHPHDWLGIRKARAKTKQPPVTEWLFVFTKFCHTHQNDAL